MPEKCPKVNVEEDESGSEDFPAEFTVSGGTPEGTHLVSPGTTHPNAPLPPPVSSPAMVTANRPCSGLRKLATRSDRISKPNIKYREYV